MLEQTPTQNNFGLKEKVYCVGEARRKQSADAMLRGSRRPNETIDKELKIRPASDKRLLDSLAMERE